MVLNSRPKISVIMTSYNYGRYIAKAIESVWSQSYPNIELVIVDDASTDNTQELLVEMQKSSPIPMTVEFNAKNLGPNATQNKAVSLASGELLAFIASDDLFEANRFEQQVDEFARHENIKIVYANGWSFSGEDKLHRIHSAATVALLQKSPNEILDYLYTHTSPLFLQTALVDKNFFLECGGNDERILADDWVLNIRFFERLVRSGEAFAYIDKDVALYRVHESNLHKVSDRQLRLREQVIETYTPPAMRRTARANIYSKSADSALAAGEKLQALRLLLKSQINIFRPLIFARFIKALITS